MGFMVYTVDNNGRYASGLSTRTTAAYYFDNYPVVAGLLTLRSTRLLVAPLSVLISQFLLEKACLVQAFLLLRANIWN